MAKKQSPVQQIYAKELADIITLFAPMLMLPLTSLTQL